MIRFWIDYITEKMAVIVLWLFIFVVVVFAIDFAFITLGVDFKYLVLPYIICPPIIFILSTITIILCFFSTKIFSKNLLIVFIVFILSAIPAILMLGIQFVGVPARQAAEKADSGTYNLRTLGKSLKKYAKRHNGLLPDANSWCDQLLADKILGLTPKNFCHPRKQELGLEGRCQFAFNKNLGRKKLSDIPGDVVLVFEADGDWNLNGTAELFQTRYRQQGSIPQKYSYIDIWFVEQKMYSYWFYEEAVRKFKQDKFGRASMYYEQPRWTP